MSTIRILVAGTALAAGLGLAACSSSSGGTGPATSPTSSQPDSTIAVAPSTGSARQPNNPAPSTAVADGGGDFCKQVSGSSIDLNAIAHAGATDKQALLDKIKTIVAAAPAKIQPDVQALEKVDEQVLSGKASADSALSDPAVLQHVQHFIGWMQSHCPGVLDVPSGLPTG